MYDKHDDIGTSITKSFNIGMSILCVQYYTIIALHWVWYDVLWSTEKQYCPRLKFLFTCKICKILLFVITSVSISTNKAILVYTRKLDLKQYLANMFIIISGRRVSHCVVCSSSIYGFWLPLWYPQTLL